MFLLSDIERDANDNVIRVGATMMTWLLDNTESVNLLKIAIIFINFQLFTIIVDQDLNI